MIITAQQLSQASGCRQSIAKSNIVNFQNAIDSYEINTPQRIAAFIAMTAADSDIYVLNEQNFNYSDNKLIALGISPNEITATESTLRQEQIANLLYADRFGNTDSGDGWLFRRRGFGLMLGRNRYVEYSNEINVNLIENPNLILTENYNFASAAWLFNRNGCNSVAEGGNLEMIATAWLYDLNFTRDEKAQLRSFVYNKALSILV